MPMNIEQWFFRIAACLSVLLPADARAQDTSLDPSFHPAINGTVSLLVPLSDGKLLIGGGFTVVAKPTT